MPIWCLLSMVRSRLSARSLFLRLGCAHLRLSAEATLYKPPKVDSTLGILYSLSDNARTSYDFPLARSASLCATSPSFQSSCPTESSPGPRTTSQFPGPVNSFKNATMQSTRTSPGPLQAASADARAGAWTAGRQHMCKD